MQFTKSDWKALPNIKATKKNGARHPGTKNSINFIHFPNARPDKTTYRHYDTTMDSDKEQLAKKGKCFFCE